MFYCEHCRIQHNWPRSVGFPYMGVSVGPCEMCKQVAECHDVPSSTLEHRRQKKLSLISCGECGERHWAKRDPEGVDYLCTFCRGIDQRPEPYEMEDLGAVLRRVAVHQKELGILSDEEIEKFQNLLDNLP